MNNKTQYDLIVIGTGSAGSTVANTCRKEGWTVAIIDRKPFGGTCALRGCDPKKTLLGVAAVVDLNRRLAGHGLTGRTSIDWPELMRFKRTFTEPMPESREKGFAEAGIDMFHGSARFTGRAALEVDGQQLEARHIVIATGAAPVDLGISGADLLTDSEEFLELDTLPNRILFVGGGYISFEFAHLAIRAGAQVTILHRGSRPLAGFDPDLVDQLVEHSRELGIDIRLSTEVAAVEKNGQAYSVRTKSQEGGQQTFEADLVVHGAGRAAQVGDLDLEAGEIDRTGGGIAVNKFLQSTSNPAVYAAGDSASTGPLLTPVAGYDGTLVAENLLQGNRRAADYPAIPSTVFTIPPLSSVGLSEQKAQEQGYKFRVNHERTTGWNSSKRLREGASGYKVLIEEKTERILGAHLLGEHTEDLINLFTLAICHNLTADQVKETLLSYPTFTYNVRYML